MNEIQFKKGQRLLSTVKNKYYIVERVSRREPKTVRVRLDESGKAFYYNIPMWRAQMIFVLAEVLP